MFGENASAALGEIAAHAGNLQQLPYGRDLALQFLQFRQLSPRQRSAVLEGSTDQTIQKFKDFVDGYYRTLATKATAQPADGAGAPANGAAPASDGAAAPATGGNAAPDTSGPPQPGQ